jgi:4-hydroxy-3-polyprenylbenzoate decarboxylase
MTARVVLGVSGASGAALALDCARALARGGRGGGSGPFGHGRTHAGAGDRPRARDELVGAGRPAASGDRPWRGHRLGSFPVQGMIVAPCSMRSLAAIAHGLDDNLLTRAASVQLKERRPLILLAREAPLTLAHLRNMTAVTEMGAVVMPPVPAFYLRPETTAEITAQIAARAVDLLRIATPRARAWTPPKETP